MVSEKREPVSKRKKIINKIKIRKIEHIHTHTQKCQLTSLEYLYKSPYYCKISTSINRLDLLEATSWGVNCITNMLMLFYSHEHTKSCLR